MKRILLPMEETERSLKALKYVKTHYSPKDVSIILTMVNEELPYSAKHEEEAAAVKLYEEKMAVMASFLEGFDVVCKAYVGKPGQKICKCAREYGASYIIMTKSSKEDMLSQIGRTAEYVIINAPCNVVILSEAADTSGEYKGLVYTKAQSVVNLRGQIGDKQSECLLPSVKADCNYHIEVSVGKVRFFHTAYNPETRNWDLPPAPGQEASVDIVAGEAADILVKEGNTEGKSDRIRIVNRGMKQEAVFTYKITPVYAEAAAAPSQVIIASQNKDKIAEINAILEKFNMKAVPRDDTGLPKDDIDETGTTCEENSLIKAKAVRTMIEADSAFADYMNCPIIADDTGLMVDALDGAPGIYSARYAGEGCTYDDNCTKLLAALEGVPMEQRSAHFETVITMLYPDGSVITAKGVRNGHIAEEKRGTEGFGYDPLFMPDCGEGKTFAELGTAYKNTVSHRAGALEELERELSERV